MVGFFVFLNVLKKENASKDAFKTFSRKINHEKN